MRITIKDIAREAGVSISTVSYVVNESGPVSKEKRELVEALVRKYNYKANPSARNLKSRRTRTIGIIGNLKKYGPDKTVIESIAKICKEKGYTMLLVADTENHEHSISFLRDHRVEGIVFIDNKTEMLGFPVPGDLPVIFAYCAHKERLSSSILPDDEQGGSLAAAHLLSKGRKRIGMITGNAGWKASRERSDGFTKVLERADLEPAGIVESSFWDSRRSYEMSVRLIKEAKPDAVFCQSDAIAFSFYHAAADSGLSIPEEIAIIGFDDIEFCTLMRPSLSSIAMPLKNIGEKAADILFHTIENGFEFAPDTTDGQTSFLLPCRLIERESSAS